MGWIKDGSVGISWTEVQLLSITDDKYGALRKFLAHVTTMNVIGDATDTIKMIMHTGQSLSIGGGSNQIVEAEPRFPEYCQMLADGTRGFGSFTFLDTYTVAEVEAFAADKLITDAPDFLPAREESAISRGETQGTGMMERLHKREASAEVPFNTYVYRSHGRGGADISLIEKGAPPYHIGLEEVRRVKDIAALYGKQVEVVALVITHGEADKDNVNYGTSLTQMITDYKTDVPLITGQTSAIPVFIDQVAPANPDGLQTVVQEIQLSVAEAMEGVYLSTPKYQFPWEAGSVHLTALGYRYLGDLQGYIISRVIHDAFDWVPLKPLSWSVDGAVITVVFNVPSGILQFDTITLPAVTNYGFTVYDGGVAATITDVSITAFDTIQITLSQALSGEAKVLKYIEGGASYQHGNLHDGLNLQALVDGYNLYNWCVVFNKSLYLPYEQEVAAIPDMKAWVNPGNGNYVLDGGSQVVLTDLSPAEADWSVPAGITVGPTVTTPAAGLNGFPVLDFLGTGVGVGGLQRSVSDAPVTTGAMTFLAVTKRTTLDGLRQHPLIGNFRTDSLAMEYANDHTQLTARGPSSSFATITDKDQTLWVIWAVSFDNDNLTIRAYTPADGVKTNTLNGTNTITTIFMGQTSDASQRFIGQLAEAFVFYRDLLDPANSTELASVVNYLQSKYGL